MSRWADAFSSLLAVTPVTPLTPDAGAFSSLLAVTPVTPLTPDNVTEAQPPPGVTGVTGVTPIKGENAPPEAEPEPPVGPSGREWPLNVNGPGLSQYTIRHLANWYEGEANRRRDGIRLDQAALDHDLRARLADHGVFPESISVEFERVMEVVFEDEKPSPRLMRP